MWYDTKAFRVISNYHGLVLFEVQQKQKNGRYQKKTSPKSFTDYGKYKGGVDTANQLRSYYERDQRSKKLWHRLFYSLLETTLVNS